MRYFENIIIEVGSDIRCIIAEVGFEHDFVQNELMMPILGIVRVKDIDEAIDGLIAADQAEKMRDFGS